MHPTPITIFGEVLFDRFPDGSRILGGAPFNVAWHLQAFGRQPLFISRIGADDAGREILKAMRRWGMNPTGLQIGNEQPTGAVEISFSNGQPSYAILDQQAYDYIQPQTDAGAHDGGLLYHGSLALRNPVSRGTFAALRQAHRGPVFLDVNLRAPWWQIADIERWMADADWLKLNDEELHLLLPGQQSLEHKMRVLQQRYQFSGLVVTCGSQGAMALDSTGSLVSVAPTNDVDVIDTVGAGDAFAAVLLLGIAENWPLTMTLERAQDFASALVGRRGAIVTEPAFYQGFVAGWR